MQKVGLEGRATPPPLRKREDSPKQGGNGNSGGIASGAPPRGRGGNRNTLGVTAPAHLFCLFSAPAPRKTDASATSNFFGRFRRFRRAKKSSEMLDFCRLCDFSFLAFVAFFSSFCAPRAPRQKNRNEEKQGQGAAKEKTKQKEK